MKNYWIFLLWLFAWQATAQTPPTEDLVNQQYEGVKLELLCRSMQFILKENHAETAAEQLNCDNLDALGNSLPKEYKQASSIFNLFRHKHYNSFGKGKLDARLDKLVKDLNSELTKLNRDRAWQANVPTLHAQLAEIKKQSLQRIADGTYQIGAQVDTIADRQAKPQPITTTPPTVAQNPATTAETSTGIGYVIVFLVLLFLLTGGACAFLYWKIQELQKEMQAKDAEYKERFSKIEAQLPTFTPLKEFQAVPPQLAFLNEQLNILIQEVTILKTRNELKPTMDELYAQRTEHLEGIRYNPNVRMHYVKYRPDVKGFNPAEFRNEPTRDSIYKLEISAENPTQAAFGIVTRSEYHGIALTNADVMLAGACEYANPPYNDTRIITHENGVAEKRGDIWVILKRAVLSFE